MYEEITIGEAYDALNASLNEYVSDGVMVSEKIEMFNIAIQNDANFRDLLLGLPKHYEIEKCVGFISYVIGQVDSQERTPYLTVLSAFAYEMGDKSTAGQLLNEALTIHSDYSLANLLKRVYLSGWPSASLAKMRDELDHKVRDRVMEEFEEIVNLNA
jgi:hypothetical protein